MRWCDINGKKSSNEIELNCVRSSNWIKFNWIELSLIKLILIKLN